MGGIQGELAGMIVQGAGTARNVVAGAAGGALGALVAGGKSEGPLGTLKKGWLSVQPQEVVLYKAKQKMTVGVKVLDEVILRFPRSAIAAVAFDPGKLVGHLSITLTDGTVLPFETPKAGNKTVDQAVGALGAQR
jgi:hypothetical protein